MATATLTFTGFPTNVTDGTYADALLAAGLAADGEIRAYLREVPIPAALPLFGFGIST